MNTTYSQVYPSSSGMAEQKVADPPDDDHDKPSFFLYKLHDLDIGQTHFKEIINDFMNANLCVLKIQRLENAMKWKAYKSNRATYLELRSNFDPSYDIRERYLYHGTMANLRDVCEVGLDDKLSRNGRYGKGIYFSDNPKKCVKYSIKEGQEGIILCARVILGESKVYPKGQQDRNLLREPEKEGQFKGWRFYDSVQGCPKDFTEYVVYRAQNVLVEYLITYSQSSLEQKLPVSSKPTSKESFRVPYEAEMSSDESTDEKEIDKNDTSSDSSDDADYEDRDKGRLTTDRRKHAESHSMKGILGKTSHLKLSECLNYKKKGQIFLKVVAKKKNEFSLLTGEHSKDSVEHFLLNSGYNVAKAVSMYQQIKAEEEGATGGKAPASIQKETLPEYNSPGWNSLIEHEEAVKELVENFLSVTSLTIKDELVARQFLEESNFNIDEAISRYYETLLNQ